MTRVMPETSLMPNRRRSCLESIARPCMLSRMHARLVIGVIGCALLVAGCGEQAVTALPVPPGLGTPDPRTIVYPDDHPPTAAQVDLGKRLFFDRRLSADGQQACATCHQPNRGLSDERRTAAGQGGKHLLRNSTGLTNVAWGTVFFADGRALSLEEQALGPLTNPDEMGLESGAIAPLVAKDPAYRHDFSQAYTDGVTLANVLHAIASFERTLISRNAPFDRYHAGDHTAMSAAAQRGMELFARVGCIECHRGPNFSNESFINIGHADQSDPGRAAIVPGATMNSAFKTPTLRNVALTFPYFHDGSLRTLAEVIAFYNRGGDAPQRHPLIRPLGLDAAAQADLVTFLEALTDPIIVTPPPPPGRR